MNRISLHKIFFTALVLITASLAAGQTARDALETLRGDLKADRKAIIAEQMNLTDSESDAFWPIYRNYRAEVEKVTDDIVKMVLEYADLYPSVPDEKASELLKKYGQAEASLLNIKRKYVKKFEKVLPASKVFRFVQLDNRYDLGIRVGLAAAIPVLGHESAPPAEAQH